MSIRRDAGTWGLQGALERRGLGPVAGVDEAGRGACAGPLVIASCILRGNDAARLGELTDSKLLTPEARDRLYDLVLARAVDLAVVAVSPADIDRYGIHTMNLEGMRRAVARLRTHPGYVLTDGFRVPGFTAPNTAVVKGDLAVACIAAASILAKVTRDRIMTEMHDELPVYGFEEHKGYSTLRHSMALDRHGPSPVHRWSFANVASAGLARGMVPPHQVALSMAAAAVVQNGRPPLAETLGETASMSQGGTRIG